VPIGMAIDGANRHDMKLVRATIEGIVVERPVPTEERPQGMCLDKGMMMMKCVQPCANLASLRTCAVAARKPGRSRAKRASAHGAGWWSAATVGSIGFAAC